MNIKEIIAKLSDEKNIPGRFPARVIFVRNIREYMSLVDELKTVCDVVLDLANYTNGDLIPHVKHMKEEIEKHKDKQILLLSLGEYLRICLKFESDKKKSSFPSLWESQQPVDEKTKYIIPILGGKEIFEAVIPFLDERQQDYIIDVTSTEPDTEVELTIYSHEFKDAIEFDARNLQEWLEKWAYLYSDSNKNTFSLCTKLSRYSEEMFGSFSVIIIDDPFAYVATQVSDGSRLEKSSASSFFWKTVAKDVVPGVPFSETIKKVLNIGHSFDPINVLARLDKLSDVEVEIFFSWYKFYPSEDYLGIALEKVINVHEIPLLIRDTIFHLSTITESIIRQRNDAMRVLNVTYNTEYFEKLDKILPVEKRLELITYITREERAYAIKTVSTLLRNGADLTTIIKLLKNRYPELAEYLSVNEVFDDKTNNYFNWYRRNKIINRPCNATINIDFDLFESRNKEIQLSKSESCISFWVDGLGAEWIPVLMGKIKFLKTDVLKEFKIAKALLPTETDYNKQWEKEDLKWDRLDKVSHRGMPDDKDYYSCIARQIEIMGEIVEHIDALLGKYNRVILTGDHGSSRLAALLFHEVNNFWIEPPENSKVRSFGRYVELDNEAFQVPLQTTMELVRDAERKFVVMKTHEHFKQSGNAAGGNTDEVAVAGEIHGGMTPEEYLVPVIVLSRKKPLPLPHQKEKSKGIEINDDWMK